MTWSNRAEGETLTLENIRETTEAIQAVPRIERDITVSPDILVPVREYLDTHQQHGHAYSLNIRIHVDRRLPVRIWHKGKPRNSIAEYGRGEAGDRKRRSGDDKQWRRSI